MKEVVLIDTSILVSWLNVPNLAKDVDGVKAEMIRLVREGASLLIPQAVIIEVGNHIGQNGDGRQRREKALKFVEIVESALNGRAPWTLTRAVDADIIRGWLKQFPEYAGTGDARGKGIGIGDVSIIAEWNHLRAVHPHRRVRIWSQDSQLSGYDTGP